MKTRNVTSVIGLGAAIVGMLAVWSPVQSLANNAQIKVTRANSMTTPVYVVKATPTVAPSFQVGLLAPSSKNVTLATAPRVSMFIHR